MYLTPMCWNSTFSSCQKVECILNFNELYMVEIILWKRNGRKHKANSFIKKIISNNEIRKENMSNKISTYNNFSNSLLRSLDQKHHTWISREDQLLKKSNTE